MNISLGPLLYAFCSCVTGSCREVIFSDSLFFITCHLNIFTFFLEYYYFLHCSLKLWKIRFEILACILFFKDTSYWHFQGQVIFQNNGILHALVIFSFLLCFVRFLCIFFFQIFRISSTPAYSECMITIHMNIFVNVNCPILLKPFWLVTFSEQCSLSVSMYFIFVISPWLAWEDGLGQRGINVWFATCMAGLLRNSCPWLMMSICPSVS